MKDEQKTETYTKTTKTTKDKPKNEAETEQKTTVVDKVPAAGQRTVHFRTLLAIIGVAAACGLSVLCVCARLCPTACRIPHCSHCAFSILGLLIAPSCNWCTELRACRCHGHQHHRTCGPGHQHHRTVDLVQPKFNCPSSPAVGGQWHSAALVARALGIRAVVCGSRGHGEAFGGALCCAA